MFYVLSLLITLRGINTSTTLTEESLHPELDGEFPPEDDDSDDADAAELDLFEGQDENLGDFGNMESILELISSLGGDCDEEDDSCQNANPIMDMFKGVLQGLMTGNGASGDGSSKECTVTSFSDILAEIAGPRESLESCSANGNGATRKMDPDLL